VREVLWVTPLAEHLKSALPKITKLKLWLVKEVETSPFSDVSTDAYYYEAVKRNVLLQGEIKELQSGIEELEKICHNKDEYRQAQEIFLPTTAHVLDYYDRMTPEEKNRLWKLLMEKITYYRDPEKPDSIEIHLYPRLGRLISTS